MEDHGHRGEAVEEGAAADRADLAGAEHARDRRSVPTDSATTAASWCGLAEQVHAPAVAGEDQRGLAVVAVEQQAQVGVGRRRRRARGTARWPRPRSRRRRPRRRCPCRRRARCGRGSRPGRSRACARRPPGPCAARWPRRPARPRRGRAMVSCTRSRAGRPASSISMFRSARVTVKGWPTGPQPWLTTTSTGTSRPSRTSTAPRSCERAVEHEPVGAGLEAGGGQRRRRR